LYPTPVTEKDAPGIQIFWTVISFWVRVPVLSVQITDVHPSVSTADNRFMRAFRFAIRCDPRARARVTVGNSPSGTNATIIPRAKIKLDASVTDVRVISMKKNKIPILTATIVTILVTWTISCCKGLFSSSIPWVRSATFPNSVFIPVAITTASPVPDATLVPAKTRFGYSIFEKPESYHGSAIFLTGWDSPVSVDWSIRSSDASIKRPSADIWSPSPRTMISPGTKSSASIFLVMPSRITRTWSGNNWNRASAAFSALNSCQKENNPLIRFTIQTAMPNCGMWAMKATIPPTQRRIAMRCVKFARNRIYIDFFRGLMREFFPYFCTRLADSSPVSPEERVSNWVNISDIDEE